MTDTLIDLAKIRAAKQANRRDDVLETAAQIRLNDTDAKPANNPSSDADADAVFQAYQEMARLILEQDISLQDTAQNLMVLLGEVLGMVRCADCRKEFHYQILRGLPGILETAMQEVAEFDDENEFEPPTG
jgi:hypothetical protein